MVFYALLGTNRETNIAHHLVCIGFEHVPIELQWWMKNSNPAPADDDDDDADDDINHTLDLAVNHSSTGAVVVVMRKLVLKTQDARIFASGQSDAISNIQH